MKRDKGYSMVELMVVIAILAVLAGAVMTGIGMLSGWRLNRCVSSIDAGLNEMMVNAMSKSACALTISCDTSGDFYLEMTGRQKEKIAQGNITILWVDDRGRETAVTATSSLMLSCSRSSGAFLPVISGIDVDGSYSYVEEEGSLVYCSEIICQMGDSREKRIRLVTDTGRHYIE